MTLEEKRKVKHAAATFVVLFVLFNILISARILTHRLPQNQWQLNTIRAETYVFKKNTWRFVVLGSSLTFRIAPGVDREDAYVMAFAGDSAFTGLEIIRRSGKLPEYIFVEVNTLGMQPDEGKIQPLFSLQGKLRRAVHAFREENTPLNFIMYPVARAILGISEGISNLAGRIAPSYKEEEKKWSTYDPFRGAVPPENKKAGEPIPRKVESEPVIVPENLRSTAETKKVEEALIRLQGAVRDVESRGAKVVFFEMPMLPSRRTDSYKMLKVKLDELFPPDHYKRVPQADDRNLVYSDGLHLDMPSSLSYAKFLMGFFPDAKPPSR